MPQLNGVLETALYTRDKERLVRFFQDVMGLRPVLEQDRLTAFDAGASTILLVFAEGGSVDGEDTPGGHIPGHDATGRMHMAFKASADQYDDWVRHLRAHGVRDLGEVTQSRGGRSFYFEDPDGHVLEIATPGLWPAY